MISIQQYIQEFDSSINIQTATGTNPVKTQSSQPSQQTGFATKLMGALNSFRNNSNPKPKTGSVTGVRG